MNKHFDRHHPDRARSRRLRVPGNHYTTWEKVVEIGPLEMIAEKTKTFSLPPIVGGIALVGGIVLLVLGNKKS